MIERRAVLALAMAAAGGSLGAWAQPARRERQYRVGLLPDLSREELGWLAEEMTRLGWVRDRDFVLIDSGVKSLSHVAATSVRMATAPSFDPGDISISTDRLLEHKPDLILATSTAYAIAAHRASKTVPVVMWTGGYPVEAGIAASLARPGKNVTGISIYAGAGIWGKLVQILVETKPGIRRVGVLWDYTPPAFPAEEMEQCFRELRSAEASLGVAIDIVQVSGSGQLPAALATLDAKHPDALVVTSGWSSFDTRQRMMSYAAERRLPVIVDFRWRSLVSPYPLLVYGASQRDLMRNAAQYVVRILNGAKAEELPLMQPSRFELLVNPRTAKTLGLTVPQSVLLRADELIQN